MIVRVLGSALLIALPNLFSAQTFGLIIFAKLLMSAHCNYYSQYCQENCCDEFGSCPSYSGRPCAYPYYSPSSRNQVVQLPLPILLGIYIGLLIVMIPMILLCFWWKNRRTDAGNKTDEQMQQDQGMTVEPTNQLIEPSVLKRSEKKTELLKKRPENKQQHHSKAERSKVYDLAIPFEAEPYNSNNNPNCTPDADGIQRSSMCFHAQ